MRSVQNKPLGSHAAQHRAHRASDHPCHRHHPYHPEKRQQDHDGEGRSARSQACDSYPYSPSEPPAMVAASWFGHTADLALALGRAFGTFFGAGCFRLREVQGRAYQRKVCKALREVPEQLAGDRIDFLR